MGVEVSHQLGAFEQNLEEYTAFNPALAKLNEVIQTVAPVLKTELLLDHVHEITKQICGLLMEKVDLRNTENILAKFKFEAD